jgi:hypothetical protein
MNNNNAYNSSSSNDSPHHHYHHSHGNNSSHHHNNNNTNNHIHHNLSSHILSFTSNLTQPFSNFLSHSTNSVLHQNNPNSFSSSNITNNTSYLNVDSTIKTIHNSISCHELHLKHNNCHSGTNPIGFHFHLAGFIDPDAGTWTIFFLFVSQLFFGSMIFSPAVKSFFFTFHNTKIFEKFEEL